jgi:hypothetical protein
LFLADDSPAPPLFYREKCAKSILDLHPAEVRDAQREGRNLEELFDRRGYRLKPLRIVSNENDLKGEWRLFDQHGRPFIFYRSERGDDKV